MMSYSLYDSKSDSYGQPFFCLTDSEATRGVILGLRAGKAVFAQFPADYKLTCIGSFNPASGSLVSLPKPRVIAEVSALMEAPANV